jgi:hypothetical protein
MHRKLIAGVALLFASSTLAFADPSVDDAAQSAPPAVRNYIAKFENDCRHVGSKPLRHAGLVTAIDLTGDRVPDYVIDIGRLECPAFVSGWNGTHNGPPIAIFVVRRDGAAYKACDDMPFRMALETWRIPARVRALQALRPG